MTSDLKLVRIQFGLFLACLALGLCYWLGNKTLHRQSAALDKPLANAAQQLDDVADRDPLLQQLATVAREEGIESIETAANNLNAAARLARQRTDLDPALRARLQEPFQLIDFENSRAEMIVNLRRLAATRKVSVSPAALAGYPEYVGGLPKPSLLWAQLSIVNQVLVTAVSQQPRLITTAESLPPRPHSPDPTQPATLDELSVRLELFGSMDAAQRFLQSLPLRSSELAGFDCTDLPIPKQALFIDRFLLRNATNRPGEIQLEVVVSGFVRPSDWTPPPQPN